MITKNNVVAVNYSLTASDVENGPETIVEETTTDNPFVFIHGNGDLLPDFELNLNDKKVGDTFDFRIKAENGYGLVHPDHVVNVPIEAFKDDEGNFAVLFSTSLFFY
jgi:FKBP-type peptidyl-prolyl cis-trans isomerase SlyD